MGRAERQCQLPHLPRSELARLSLRSQLQDEARRAATICGYIIVESSASSRRRPPLLYGGEAD
eukprot:scaffold1074_cov124-Skeletonema_dohrnii-CCMP3373.AAC.2